MMFVSTAVIMAPHFLYQVIASLPFEVREPAYPLVKGRLGDSLRYNENAIFLLEPHGLTRLDS